MSKETLQALRDAAKAHRQDEEQKRRYAKAQVIDVELDLGVLGDRMVEVCYTYSPEESPSMECPGRPEEWDIHYVLDSFAGVLTDLSSAIDETAYQAIVEAVKYELNSHCDYDGG